MMASDASNAPSSSDRSFLNRLGASALIAVMVVASLMLWIGIPLGWLVIGSLTVDSSQPSMGPYALVFIGIVVSVVITARFIGRVNRTYERVAGNEGKVRIQLPWMRSMRGERGSDLGKERSVLDIVMVSSVGLAATVAGVWFLFFAGSSLPGG